MAEAEAVFPVGRRPSPSHTLPERDESESFAGRKNARSSCTCMTHVITRARHAVAGMPRRGRGRMCVGWAGGGGPDRNPVPGSLVTFRECPGFWARIYASALVLLLSGV